MTHALGLAAVGLRRTLLLQTGRSLSRLGFAACLAILAGEMIEAGRFETWALAGALLTLGLAAATGIGAALASAKSEAALVETIRGRIETALGAMSPMRLRARPAGAMIAGLERHPVALASLVMSHAAAKRMLAVGPLLSAAAIALVSWEAALALVLATPVMVVFFALLGAAVREKAESQERDFGRLAAQFSDRIRTLPTIIANHALTSERAKIEARMETYAASTMKVLSVAFLNAGVIDFFSALSIALLAVFLGLGHLGLLHIPGFSGLHLSESLFVLIAAADYFTPFRHYAEQYHAKAEGEAAAAELDWYFGAGPANSESAEPIDPMLGAPHTGKAVAFDLPPRGIVAITGPSGSGKSKLLRFLAGVGREPFDDDVANRNLHGSAWVSTDIYVPEGTLADAISWGRKPTSRAMLHRAAGRVGLLDDRLLSGGIDARIEEGGQNLSGGQRLRIGVARALLSGGIVFADEPTAKLDHATAGLVRRALGEVARKRLVIVATHDAALIERADRVIVMDASHQVEALAA